jgi:DNA ligase (NAD+)
VACERLVKAGIQSIREVFSMTAEDFEVMGFGAGQANNLCRELREARRRSVDDFRVLAALGIEHLGRGDSKRLLKHFSLKDVPGLTVADINAISGFGDLTANAIVSTLPSVSDDLVFLERNLTGILVTPSRSEVSADSPINGKHIVFTGTMHGSRSEMIAQAESLGATSQSSVTSKTHFLVAGEKVGASKLNKAEQLGTTILSESDYLALVGGSALMCAEKSDV